MIKARKLTKEEEFKNANMDFALEFSGQIQFFTRKGLEEMQDKINIALVQEIDLRTCKNGKL